MRRLAVPFLLLAMTVLVSWRLVLSKQYTFLDSPDLTNQVAPWLQVQANAWQHGDFPLLWDPYVAGGQSLIGQAQPATAFPMNWILFLLPLRNGFIQMGILHSYMTLVHFFAALACYALCRDLKRSRAASILSAAAYSFGGYVATTWWPQQVQSTIFAPLALLFSFRAIRGDRPLVNCFLSGFFLGVMWLGGHHQVPIFIVLGISGMWIYHVAVGKNGRLKINRAVCFAMVIGAMVMAGALQLFPSFSYGHDSIRWVGSSHAVGWNGVVPYSVHDEFSQPAFGILGVFMNGFFLHADPFVGFTVFLLAIVAVTMAWDQLAVRLLGFLALGGMLLAYGGHTPLHQFLYAVLPMVEKARTPAVAIIVFHLGICPLAAFGVDRILENPRSNWLKVAAIASGVVGFLLFILAIHVEIYKPAVNWQFYNSPLTALAALLLAALIAGIATKRIDTRTAGVWFVVLVMMEIGNLGGAGWTNRDKGWRFWPALERDRDVAQFLKKQPGLFRVEAKIDDVPYSFGDWYGIESFTGYTASLMEIFTRVLGEPTAHRLLGVKYYLANAPRNPNERELMAGTGGIKVFEVADAMPRTWAVHEVATIQHPQENAALNTFDLAHKTFFPEAAPTLETCEGDRTVVVKHEPQFVSIDADMNCRGMVILGDVYSKDWVATVDGRSTPIYQAYSFIRGVVAERGHHRIEYIYRPWAVYWGALLTFMSFGIALVLGIQNKRRTEDRTV